MLHRLLIITLTLVLMTVISPGGAHAALLQATARYTMVNPFDVNTGGTDESLIGGDSFGSRARIRPNSRGAARCLLRHGRFRRSWPTCGILDLAPARRR